MELGNGYLGHIWAFSLIFYGGGGVRGYFRCSGHERMAALVGNGAGLWPTSNGQRTMGNTGEIHEYSETNIFASRPNGVRHRCNIRSLQPLECAFGR